MPIPKTQIPKAATAAAAAEAREACAAIREAARLAISYSFMPARLCRQGRGRQGAAQLPVKAGATPAAVRAVFSGRPPRPVFEIGDRAGPGSVTGSGRRSILGAVFETGAAVRTPPPRGNAPRCETDSIAAGGGDKPPVRIRATRDAAGSPGIRRRKVTTATPSALLPLTRERSENVVVQMDIEDAPALRDAAPPVPRGPQLPMPLALSRGINETDFISYTQCKL